MSDYKFPDGKREMNSTLEERVDKMIHIYELQVQSLKGRMPEFERRGAAPYYKHRLTMYSQFVDELKTIRGRKD